MTDADIVREALNVVKHEVRGFRDGDAFVSNAKAALDRLVARLATAEGTEKLLSQHLAATAERLAQTERDRNLFRDTLAKANERAAAAIHIANAAISLVWGAEPNPRVIAEINQTADEWAKDLSMIARGELPEWVRGGEEQRT